MTEEKTDMLALAKEALEIQDACNLSGLAQRFAKVTLELRHHPDCTGTDWCNQHPIVILWLDKFCSLARTQNNDAAVWHAYDQVHAMLDASKERVLP